MWDLALPGFSGQALRVWARNARVWQKTFTASVLMNIGEPFLYLLGLGYGLGAFIGELAGMPYLTFLATGMVAASAMNTATFEGLYSVFTRLVPQQTYEAILATPTGVDDILLGEMLWCATKGVISGAAILLVAMALGAVQPLGALLSLPSIFLISLCFSGPAIATATLAKGYDFFSYYSTLALTPMFILCGVFYPVTALPEPMQVLVSVLPLTHAVELVRPVLAGQAPDNPLLNVAVLTAYAVAGYYLAVILGRRRMRV